MRKQAFQEIARHFAESIDVQLVFEEGATPSTNGKMIILPTEMSEQYLDETLGALLHETNHIRYTEMSTFRQMDKLQLFVGNALEDIRVDYKSLQTYPNSKCFYMSLIDDVLVRAKDKLAAEELPVKKVKSLILAAYGVDLKTVYGTDEHYDEIQECTNDLQKVINEVYQCPTSQDIVQYIPAVIKRIFGEQEPKDQEQQQQGAGSPQGQPCNGGQGGDGECQDGHEGDPHNEEPDPDDPNDAGHDSPDDKEDLSNIVEEYVEKLEKKTEAEKEANDAAQEYKDTYSEYQRLNRSRKTYNTKARRTNSSIIYGQNTKENQEKLEYYKQKAEERYQEASEQAKKLNEASRATQAANSEKYQAQNEFEKIKDKVNKGFGQAEQCNLLGFNALDEDKLKDKNYVEVEYNPSLDEIIKEALILKQEELQVEETGRINSRYLHEIYTDVENIFQEKEERKIKTRVSVVIDKSGSMTDYRTSMCLRAVNLLANAFKKAINEGAPGDMRIYSFSDDVKLVMDKVDAFQSLTSESYSKLTADIYCGGTNLARAVNHVVNDVEGDPEYRNVIIVVTDAEVDQREIDEMTNNISTSDARVMYIAVDANFGYCPRAKELFSGNIKTNKEAPQILEQAMFQGLQTVN